MPGDLALGERAPGASGIEGQWGLCAGAPRDWGKWRPHSWKVHTGFHVHWVTGQSRGSMGIWVGLEWRSWRISWENRGWLWLVGEGHWRQSSREYSPGCASRGGYFGKIWPTHHHWEARGQTKIQVGSQPHPSVNRLPKDYPPYRHIATSNLTQRQTHTHGRDRNQPHLPVRGHQQLPPGSTQQAPVPTSTTRGSDTRTKRGRVPVPAQQKRIWLGTMRLWVQSLALLSGLRIGRCHELWCRLQTRLGSGIAVALV